MGLKVILKSVWTARLKPLWSGGLFKKQFSNFYSKNQITVFEIMYVCLIVKAMVVQPFVIIYSYVGICMVLAQRYEKFFSIDIIQNTHTQGLA